MNNQEIDLLQELLPQPMFEIRFLDLALWQWTGLLLAMLVAWIVSWIVVRIAVYLVRPVTSRTQTALDDEFVESARSPGRLLVALACFATATVPLGLGARAQGLLSGAVQTLTLIGLGWLAFRFVDVLAEWARRRLERRNQSSTTAVIPLGRRTIKAAVGLLVGLGALDNFGVNVTGLLAGLGVGGLAVALAARPTLENLFGGVTVMADQPVRVGDFCRFGERLGWVQEIGLRSTRVRTLDRTVVTVPNAEFSAMQLENFARRDKTWYRPTIGLRYETSPDQLRYVLVEVRRMLYAHPRVDPDPARIRFTGFGAYSLDLDVFAYIKSTDYGEFLEIAEDLNLRIMDIIERAGTGFAFPSQTTYLGRDNGLNKERVEAVEDQVQRWRDSEELFLPRFPEEEMSRVEGTLHYPPEGSPARQRAGSTPDQRS